MQRTFAQLLSVEVTPDTTFEKGGSFPLPFSLPTAEHAEAAEISRSFLCADGVLGGEFEAVCKKYKTAYNMPICTIRKGEDLCIGCWGQ